MSKELLSILFLRLLTSDTSLQCKFATRRDSGLRRSSTNIQLGCKRLCPVPNWHPLSDEVLQCHIAVRGLPTWPCPLRLLKMFHRFSIALMCYGAFSPVGAFLCYRFKLVRSLITTGFSCLVVFNILATTSTLGSQKAFWGYQVILGAGLAFVLNGLVTAAQLSAPPKYM